MTSDEHGEQVQLDPDQEESPVIVTSGETAAGEHRIPEILPLLPIRDAVAYPGVVMPLDVGREKSMRLVNDVLNGDKLMGVVAQRRPELEDPSLNDLYRVGTVCQVIKLLRMPGDRMHIIVHGLARFGVEELVQSEPYLKARIHLHEPKVEITQELQAMLHTVRTNAAKVVEMSPNLPEEAKTVLENIEEPNALADFIAANLSLNLVQKQELLETFDVMQRLVKVNQTLASQLEVLALSSKIQQQVKESIDKTQREYWLHEQLKAIQRELGETDQRTAEVEELRAKVAEAKMPPEAEKEANREIDRLGRIPAASPEYSVAVDYVRWLCEMPWSVSTEDILDIRRAEKILDEDHYDLEKVKKRIIEFLAVRKLKPDGRGPILCFVGPPGVGKTSLGQSIARALGRKFLRISLGGMRDEAEIRGHRRTYIGAMPGRIIQDIRKAGANNPVFMLDEIDKLGQDFRGDPASALLEVLDPAQNKAFSDHYLDVPFDLSRVLFIATANYMEPVPPALRDRVEIIELPGYTQREKLFIAKKYLIRRQIEENGLAPSKIVFDDQAVNDIIAKYTREAGVRELERQIGTICRGVAARIAKGAKRLHKITSRRLVHYLGPPKFIPELAMRTTVPGVATGLAYTPVGGEIIFVECSIMPGKGNLLLTGQIGEVMKESAQAAFSLLRSRAKKFGVQDRDLANSDIHIHVPAGAVPKDGPSAGVAMLTSLVSLCTNRPVRSDLAMTGEVTLRGLVLPIGGVKEKTLAAKRAGIKTVVLPEGNRKDLADVPPEVRDSLDFVFARNVDRVLDAAFNSNDRPKKNKKTPRAAGRRS